MNALYLAAICLMKSHEMLGGNPIATGTNRAPPRPFYWFLRFLCSHLPFHTIELCFVQPAVNLGCKIIGCSFSFLLPFFSLFFFLILLFFFLSFIQWRSQEKNIGGRLLVTNYIKTKNEPIHIALAHPHIAIAQVSSEDVASNLKNNKVIN